MEGQSADELQPGLYDTVLSQALVDQIGALNARRLRAKLDEVDPAELPDRIAELIGGWARDVVTAAPTSERPATALALASEVSNLLVEHHPHQLRRRDAFLLLVGLPAGTLAHYAATARGTASFGKVTVVRPSTTKPLNSGLNATTARREPVRSVHLSDRATHFVRYVATGCLWVRPTPRPAPGCLWDVHFAVGSAHRPGGNAWTGTTGPPEPTTRVTEAGCCSLHTNRNG